MTYYSVEQGRSYPLGATTEEMGVNFSLFSAHAEKVELCVFDESGRKELQRFTLPSCENNIWFGCLKGAKAGLVYGYRVYGPYQPKLGHRFNHHKLLLDPYARALKGQFTWSERHLGYQAGSPELDLSFDNRDNADVMLKAVVIDPCKPTVQRVPVPWKNTVIYEGHVKGLTQLNSKVPAELQGSFLGISHSSMIAHYRAMGITTIELLPVQQFISEKFLQNKNLSNYWGYNSLSFFVPHSDYLNTEQVFEFKQMVDELHQAGLEVLIDVVYNHTAESDCLGPTLSFRGIDNKSYYRLNPEEPRYYINDTGCGNTVNMSHPRVLQMVMDSLRYWVEVMGVDGFRFDLASILGRENHGFDKHSGFLDAILQDPIINTVKVIAEPWDIGPGGYQLGEFPAPWSEWNDKYRDCIRRFWRGDEGTLPEFARRIHGSSDVFEQSERQPYASLNFLTSHDGFTLHDLVSYEKRHNERNGEDNRDGHSENLSKNYGEEGYTEQENILSLRLRQIKNMLSTLMLSQGVPMVLGGDELGRTQQGNNNAYCQNNDINWLNWDEKALYADELTPFLSTLTEIRSRFPMLSYHRFIHDNDPKSDAMITWLHSSGKPMNHDQWHIQSNRTLGYLLQSKENNSPSILCIFHSGDEPIEFGLSEINNIEQWELLINTAESVNSPMVAGSMASITLQPYTTIVLANKE